jgi:AmiR/NasT family two-component response regulator
VTAVGFRIETGSAIPAGADPATPRWRIVLVDDHEKTRALVTSTVVALGGSVVAQGETAASGFELVERHRPDAVILAVGLPDQDGVELATDIMTATPCPIVLLTSRAQGPIVQRARLAGAMGYLLKPLRPEELEPAIELAIARFDDLHRASRENASLRRALAERKLVEQAKGLLMQRLGLSEPEAFRLLQRTAMDRRVAIVTLAEVVIKGEGLPARTRSGPRR